MRNPLPRALNRGPLVIAALILVACGMTNDARPAQYADLKKRAAFDFPCPEGEIQVTPIKENEGSSCTMTFHSVSVAGASCRDKRGTYVYDGYRGLWVLNNDSQGAK